MSRELGHFILGEHATFRNGLNFSKESRGNGCLLVGVSDFKDRFSPDYQSLSEINPDGIVRQDDYLQQGDIVFVRSNGNKALVGRSLYIDKDVEALFSGFCIRARLTSTKIDKLFCAYFTRTANFKSQISSSAGTNINNLNQEILSQVKVPAFEKNDQKKISAVLFALDAKIDYNHRINAELEALAKTLHDYWFVQFDFPDANGKPYKSSGGRMVYNAALKREIPEGWKATSLASITPTSNDALDPGDFPNKEFRHFSIPVWDATKAYGLETGQSIGSNKFTVLGTDLLVSKLNPWFNRVIYAMEEEDQICSTELVVWRCPSHEIKNFLYLIATSPQFIAHCTQSATGTSNSHKRVNPDVMMRFALPYQDEVAALFGQKISPILKRMILNQRENQQLTQLRDWLLPLLMNGQVQVA